jgi:AcrR family transcriptional regulator
MRKPVKGTTEAGRRREQRAHRTRERIVDAAHRLFLDHGYNATTVEAIAHRAGVAPATVYQAFGTKQAILSRVLDVEIAGDTAAVSILDRDWVQRAADESDGRRRLALIVAGAASVAARTAPIKEVMRDAAATDRAAAELIEQDTARRLATQRALVDLVLDVQPLRPGVDHATAVATFFALVNSDTHRLLVGHLGWTTEQWTRWLQTTLEHQLIDPGAK